MFRAGILDSALGWAIIFSLNCNFIVFADELKANQEISKVNKTTNAPSQWVKNESKYFNSKTRNEGNEGEIHDDISYVLKELHQISEKIDSIQDEHDQISQGVSEISKVVKDVNTRSENIKKKVKKISKTLSKSNFHHKLKNGIKNLQKDHKKILESVHNSTIHNGQHHHNRTNHKHQHKHQKHCNKHPNSHQCKSANQKVSSTSSAPEETTTVSNLNTESTTNITTEAVVETEHLPTNCDGVRNWTSGIHLVQPEGFSEPVKVWCDHTTEGGGWTMILSRLPQENQQDFSNNWEQYKNGFGDPASEYWIGNEVLHAMTKSGKHELRVNITNWSDEEVWAMWKEFGVSSEIDGYTLTVNRYIPSSNAGDALKWHNGMKFSTPDRDNDKLLGGHCAKKNKGGWWYRGYRGCYQAHPTGKYQKNPSDAPSTPQNKRNFDLGPVLAWQDWRGQNYYPKTLFMMFRPALY